MSDSLVDRSESHLVRDGLRDYRRAQNKSGGSERCLRAIVVAGISSNLFFFHTDSNSKMSDILDISTSGISHNRGYAKLAQYPYNENVNIHLTST